jgi:hypothetical protein
MRDVRHSFSLVKTMSVAPSHIRDKLKLVAAVFTGVRDRLTEQLVAIPARPFFTFCHEVFYFQIFSVERQPLAYSESSDGFDFAVQQIGEPKSRRFSQLRILLSNQREL